MKRATLTRLAFVEALACAVLAPVAHAAAQTASAPASDAAATSDPTERNTDRFGPWVPDYARLQTGGYVGSLAIGFGYGAFDDLLNVGLLYGFTHDDVVGNIHSLELSFSLRLVELRAGAFRFVPFYFGFGVLGTSGERYYLGLPNRYPNTYYRPNAIWPIANLGLEVDYVPKGSLFERHGLFVELKVLEYYAGRYFRNPDTVDITDAASLALGYRAAF